MQKSSRGRLRARTLVVVVLILASTVVPTAPAHAGFFYRAVTSGLWSDPATWGGTVPKDGADSDFATVEVPAHISVTIPPGETEFMQRTALRLDGLLFVGGSAWLGEVFIRSGGELWVQNGEVDVLWDLDNFGLVGNNGTFHSPRHSVNESSGIVRNFGYMKQRHHQFASDGFFNYGRVENAGYFDLPYVNSALRSQLHNDRGGTFVNKASGVVGIDGRFNNLFSGAGRGLIENYGEINIGPTGTLTNEGYVEQHSTLNNAGVVQHNGGDIRAHCGSTFTGNPVVNAHWVLHPAPRNWCDSMAPVLDLPAPIKSEATGPDGASVSYHAIAKDDLDPSPVVKCSPASGSSFSLGTTTVACTATDYVGNSSSGSFSVTVGDTTKPNINLVGTDSVIVQHNAYSDPGASSSDTVDGDLTGSIVTNGTVDVSQPGIYTIQYSVSDTSGNTSMATRTVTVVTAADATDTTIEQIEELGLPSSQTEELLRPLERASQLLHDAHEANDSGACRLLDVFIDTAQRQQRRGELSTQQSDLVVEQAAQIKTGIGCQ